MMALRSWLLDCTLIDAKKWIYDHKTVNIRDFANIFAKKEICEIFKVCELSEYTNEIIIFRILLVLLFVSRPDITVLVLISRRKC